MQPYFDPYYHLLGIPPHEQPADHYRLLGLNRFESNRAVISAAADQRISHAQAHILGVHGAAIQKLVGELEFARLTLLDPVRKANYDAILPSMLPMSDEEGPQRPSTTPPHLEKRFEEAPPPASPPQAFAQPVVPTLASPNLPGAVPVRLPAPVQAPLPTGSPVPPVTSAQVPQSPKPVPTRFQKPPARPENTKPSESSTQNKRNPVSGFAPGEVVDRYRILEKTKSSPLGNVYKVQDVDWGRLYFLKSLPAASARDPQILRRFQREIEIITALEHPNLISGKSKGIYQDNPYLVMEYVVGTDLGTLVEQRGKLPVVEAVSYLTQAAEGLKYLHSKGVIHRNIKPQVLLLDNQGRIRIWNLLLAKVGDSEIAQPDDGKTMQGEQLGTLDYLPPEQAFDAHSSDGRSDIYCLGCTLFFMLNGRPPYVAKRTAEKIMAHCQSPIPDLCKLREDVPSWVNRIFQRTMAKNPDDRFQSVDDLLVNIERSSNGKETGGQPGLGKWWETVRGFFGQKE